MKHNYTIVVDIPNKESRTFHLSLYGYELVKKDGMAYDRVTDVNSFRIDEAIGYAIATNASRPDGTIKVYAEGYKTPIWSELIGQIYSEYPIIEIWFKLMDAMRDHKNKPRRTFMGKSIPARPAPASTDKPGLIGNQNALGAKQNRVKTAKLKNGEMFHEIYRTTPTWNKSSGVSKRWIIAEMKRRWPNATHSHHNVISRALKDYGFKSINWLWFPTEPDAHYNSK